MSNVTGRQEKEEKIFEYVEGKLTSQPQILLDYYYHMRAQSKSAQTIVSYIPYIISLFEMFQIGDDKSSYENITPDMIGRYFIETSYKKVNGQKVKISNSSYNTKWYALTSFFKYLQMLDLIKKNPVLLEFKSKGKDKVDTTYLTQDEVNDVLATIRKSKDKRIKNRDAFIFMLGITTGLRASAITQINLQDINHTERKIQVIEKRDKEYDVCLSENVYQALLRWLDDREHYFPNVESDALLLTIFGKRMGYDALFECMQRYHAPSIEGKKKLTPHVMRHTCATLLYNQTGDIYLTSKQLHHSHVSTTQRYAELLDGKLQEATNLLGGLIK